MMLRLQQAGCHNINLVTPSHVVPQIIKAVYIAAEHGLVLPIVYNTSSYDTLASLALLDGVVDIYLADLKYGDSELALRYSKVPSYVEVSQAAVKEMFRQVGDLMVDQDGIAQRGLMIRHLVLPNRIAGTETVMRFLAEQVSTDTYVNLMSQYRPCYQADLDPAINRRITRKEFSDARHMVERFGLRGGEIQMF
jgi:putative pyruvate formate lyase activating enzyme